MWFLENHSESGHHGISLASKQHPVAHGSSFACPLRSSEQPKPVRIMYVIEAQIFSKLLSGVWAEFFLFVATSDTVSDWQASWASPQAVLGGAESQDSLGVFVASSA